MRNEKKPFFKIKYYIIGFCIIPFPCFYRHNNLKIYARMKDM